jgi:hypothetical protein
MRNSNQPGDKYNPPAQRYHIESFILAGPGVLFTDSARIYWDQIPQIETGQLVGLFIQGEWFAKGINNISSTTPIPQQSFTTDVLRGFNTLFVTIVNTKGEILFNMIPYASLYPINGKIFPYNAVNIDTKKCYFTYSPGVRIGGPLSAQLGFLMNYQ